MNKSKYEHTKKQTKGVIALICIPQSGLFMVYMLRLLFHGLRSYGINRMNFMPIATKSKNSQKIQPTD